MFKEENVFQIDTIDNELLTKQGISDQGVFTKITKSLVNGYITFETPITRAGIYDYYDTNYPGNIRREYRSVEEVFNKDSLESILSVPVFKLHPDIGRVTSENFKTCSKDFVGATHPHINYNLLKQEDHLLSDGLLRVSYTIFDQDTIDELSSKELNSCSVGYSCSRVYEPGEINGYKYDSYQKNIKYNHLAIVPYGRMGLNINGNLISLDSITNKEKQIFIMGKEQKSEKSLDESETSNDVTLQATLTKLQAVQDALSITVENNNKLTEENKTLKEKLETLDSSSKNVSDSVDALVNEKLTKISDAYKYISKFSKEDISLDSLLNIDVDEKLVSIAKKVAPSRDFENSSQAKIYLDCLEEISKQLKNNDLSNILTQNTISNNTNDSNDTNVKTKNNKYDIARENWLKNK